MTKYKRLTLEEREQIFALVNQGKSNRDISIILERSHTTIAKELRRCDTKFEYSPSKAHKQARGKDLLRRQQQIIDERSEVFQEVLKRLALRNSPEQISQSLKKEVSDNPKKRNVKKSFHGVVKISKKA